MTTQEPKAATKVAVHRKALCRILDRVAETMIFVKPNMFRTDPDPWVVMRGQGGDPPRARVLGKFRTRPEAEEFCRDRRLGYARDCLAALLEGVELPS